MHPKSATNDWINWAGVVCFFLTIYLCKNIGIKGIDSAIAAMTAYAGTIMLLEVLILKTPLRSSVGLDFSQNTYVPARVLIKLIGLYGSIGFIALLYWIFPEYKGSFYNPYWELIDKIALWYVLLSVPYAIYMDTKMKNPYDSYWYFGKLLLLQLDDINIKIIIQHLLGWVVKGFFFPLMLIPFSNNVQSLMQFSLDNVNSFKDFFNSAVQFLFTLDLLAAVVGYLISFRFFDSHIRSSEPTLLGWLVCIICYQPFASTALRLYLAYSGNYWMDWLSDYPTMQVIWGIMALILLSIYSWASINFGIRFSNITYRGTLTHGAYRLTKHPAYVSKNLYWWAIHIPFIPTQGWIEALRFSIMLLGVNLIYYLRAKTEETHLSHYPEYVEYALWMNEHSIFSKLAKKFPFLQYKVPTTPNPMLVSK